MRPTRWTDEETALARKLIAANATDAEFWEAFGRTRSMAVDRIRYVDVPRYRNRGKCSRTPIIIHPMKAIPDEVFADAYKRASAPRSITAFVFGDPAPGFSALDRRAS